MLRLYVIGILILLIAILANIVATKFGVQTWYDFLNNIGNKGIEGIKSLGIANALWLFIVYPFCLGLGYWLGDKFYQLL